MPRPNDIGTILFGAYPEYYEPVDYNPDAEYSWIPQFFDLRSRLFKSMHWCQEGMKLST